jgi:hypothetical protein
MNNPPAFPRPYSEDAFLVDVDYVAQDGMSLRDYFAAKAMQGFLQYSATKGIYTPPDNELAKASYDLADAMLKARDKS